MNLILEVVDGGTSQAGSGTRKIFGLTGGRIGRAPDCDWVLASPYISRHHATISCADGVFYVESAGDNGVAVNDQNALLDRAERRALRSGDTLFIDEIRIRVAVSAAAPVSQVQPPVSRDPTLPPGPLAPASDDLDPLSKLGRIAGPNTTSPPSAAWTHSPSVSDHFRPPSPIVQQRQAPSPAPVDEDWNQTVYDREQLQPEPVPVPPVVERVPPPQPPPPQKTAPPAPTPVSPAPARVPRPAAEPSTRTGLPRDSLASRPDGRPSGLDLEAALRQLGIEPADLARETVDELAKVAQSVLQGLIDVLRARAQLRNQLRLPAVRVQSTRNNPFDFAINAQDALGSLIDHANPGYLPAAEAFADTFGDMRRHELATLAGIRAGFQSMLRLFEPQAMQDRFDRQLKHAGFLPLGAKLRYWELYSDLYEQLQGDPDGTFQRMFGQAFADAYARQLDALRSVPDGNR